MRKAFLSMAVAALALAWPAATATVAPAASAAAASGPCGTMTAPPTFRHVIWIWMENHSFSDIIGNTSQAPYINSLATECGLATNYNNISHPSLPNYIAATSGLSVSQVRPFKSDCSPSKKCSTTAPSIFGQGESWKAYEESMPTACATANAGEYAVATTRRPTTAPSPDARASTFRIASSPAT